MTKLLRYSEPAKCHSRDSEVANSKTEKKLKVDTNTLAICESKSVPDESILDRLHTIFNVASNDVA